MSAIALTKTLPLRGAVDASAAKPAKGFFARMMDAIIAARVAQAERELARYMVRTPDQSR